MKEIKVAFFAHDTSLKTGGNNSLLNLIDGLARYNVACFVFVPGAGEFADALRQRNVPFLILPNFFWISGFIPGESTWRIRARLIKKILKRIPFLIRYLPTYIRQVKSWQPDILYTNTTAIFEGALVSWMLNKPHIWHVRELKDIGFKYDFGNAFFKFLLKKADAQIFVSQALKNALSSYYVPSKAYIVYNGLPAPQEKNQIQKDENYTFAMVGRLQAYKNPSVAIKAISYLKNKYPQVRLLLAGGGTENYIEPLKKLVSEYDVEDKVVFLGEVADPYEKVYSVSDAYLMCSVNETFGRVTVEAMLAKLPVIGYKSEITGTKEIVEDGVTGLLYKGDVEELAQCMEKFIVDPAWAESLGQNGYERALQRFSLETYTENIYRIIQDLASHT